MGELALLAVLGFALLGSRSSSSRRPRSSSELVPARRSWRAGRDQWTRDTFTEVVAALHSEVPEDLRNAAAAAMTAVAARESGFGDREHNNNPFCLHASSGPRARVGSEVLASFPDRRTGIAAAVRALEGARYRSALTSLVLELDAARAQSGAARVEALKSAAADYHRRLELAGWAPPGGPARLEEQHTIAGGVFARLTRTGVQW